MPVNQSVNITINNSDTQGQRQKQEQSEGDFSPGNSGNNGNNGNGSLVPDPKVSVVVESSEEDNVDIEDVVVEVNRVEQDDLPE